MNCRSRWFRFIAAGLLLILSAVAPGAAESADPGDALRKAASRGDLATVSRLLAEGADANAATEHGATALSYAADKGHAEVVALLIEHGADVDVKDTFYGATPITWAAYNGRVAVVETLLEHGAAPGAALVMAINRDQAETVRALARSGKLSAEAMSSGLEVARQAGKGEIVDLLEEAGAKAPPPAEAEVDRAVLERYVGRYTSDQGPYLVVALAESGELQATFMEQPPLALAAVDETTFRPPAFAGLTLSFAVEEGRVTGLTANQAGTEIVFQKETEPEEDTEPDEDDGESPDEDEPEDAEVDG